MLGDEDLVRVVRTNAMQYALAVAGRERLSELVSEALVETGHEEVVTRLVDNGGARLSQSTLQRVIQDFSGSEQVHTRVVRRPELPHEVVEQLIGVLGDRLEWQLIRERRMPADEARALITAVRDRAAISFTARAHADGKLQQHLLAEFSAGRLATSSCCDSCATARSPAWRSASRCMPGSSRPRSGISSTTPIAAISRRCASRPASPRRTMSRCAWRWRWPRRR